MFLLSHKHFFQDPLPGSCQKFLFCLTFCLNFLKIDLFCRFCRFFRFSFICVNPAYSEFTYFTHLQQKEGGGGVYAMNYNFVHNMIVGCNNIFVFLFLLFLMSFYLTRINYSQMFCKVVGLIFSEKN